MTGTLLVIPGTHVAGGTGNPASLPNHKTKELDSRLRGNDRKRNGNDRKRIRNDGEMGGNDGME